MKKALFAAVAAASTLLAVPAHAVPIIGSLSFSGGFDPGGLPAAPSTSIVSALASVDVNNVADVFTAGSGTDAFAATASGLAFDLLPPAFPTTFFTTDTGFTFTITGLSVNNASPLACAGGLCSDSIAFNVNGVVSAAGFDDTEFLGSWTANGSCLGGAGTCESAISGSWSSSLTATGRPEMIPEAGSLALLGLGMLGLGFARRRHA